LYFKDGNKGKTSVLGLEAQVPKGYQYLFLFFPCKQICLQGEVAHQVGLQHMTVSDIPWVD
jgi:hypothetical protein